MAHLYLGEGTGAPRPPGWARIRKHPAHGGLHRPELAKRLTGQVQAWFKIRFQSSVAGVGDRRTTPQVRGVRSGGSLAMPARPQPPTIALSSLATRPPRHIPDQSSPRSTTMKSNGKPLVAGVGCQSTHLDPCGSSQQTISRELQPTNRQVRLVYRCWNFAVKVSFNPTFGDPRRAFQAAMLTRHIVAATGDRA